MRTINENTATKTSRAAVRPEHNRIWILVFIFSFLGLMIDGADLMLLSYSLTSIKAEFGLTSVEAGSLGSITLAGMAIGGIYGGWACDRFGRVKTVSWTIVLFSIGTAVLGLTHSYFQFAVARFVSSLGLGALYVACNTLMAEYVPTKYRTTALGTLQAGWSVGYIVATVLAGAILPVYGWRYLFFVAIVPVIIALLMHKGVPEPESWVRAKAERETGGSKFTTAKRESAFKAIFGNPRVRTLFIFWALTAGFLQFGYYGVNNWLPSYLETEMGMNFKSMTAYMIGSYTAMILSKVLAGVAADWLGRRAVFALGALGTAAFLPIIVLYHSPDTICGCWWCSASSMACLMASTRPIWLKASRPNTRYGCRRRLQYRSCGRSPCAGRHWLLRKPDLDRLRLPRDGRRLFHLRRHSRTLHPGKAVRS